MQNMMDMPPAEIPSEVAAGDSLRVANARWAASFPSAGGWAVRWILSAVSGGAPLTVEGGELGGAWVLSIAAGDTSGWTPGDWVWTARAVRHAETVTIGRGKFCVLPDPASTSADRRSHARKTLDAIEAAIEGRASKTDLEVQFEDGRRIRHMDHAQLLAMRDAYAAKVRAEGRRAAGGGGGYRILAVL